MTIVKVVNVPVVDDGLVAAAGSVDVVVGLVNLAVGHGSPPRLVGLI